MATVDLGSGPTLVMPQAVPVEEPAAAGRELPLAEPRTPRVAGADGGNGGSGVVADPSLLVLPSSSSFGPMDPEMSHPHHLEALKASFEEFVAKFGGMVHVSTLSQSLSSCDFFCFGHSFLNLDSSCLLVPLARSGPPFWFC